MYSLAFFFSPYMSRKKKNLATSVGYLLSSLGWNVNASH